MSEPRESIDDNLETQYWLLGTSRGDWTQLQEHGSLASAGSKDLDKVCVGDVGVVSPMVCSGRYDSAIECVIVFTVTSKTVRKPDTLFNALYSTRMSPKVEEIFDPPILFRPFVEEASSMSDSSNYGACLQGLLVKPLTFDDYQILVGRT